MSAENEIEEHGTTPTTEQPSQPPTLQLEEQSPFVQDGVAKKNLQEAKVTYLDGSQQSFWVHKNADGEVLFNMVAAQLNLIEKDYFALSFYNELNVRLWLYKEKKITKQLKGRPWEFEFVVKFYPPEPDQLVEDFTRHLMVLQLRHDVFTERLPFVFEKLALLGSYVAQSELGDYQPSDHYDDFLRQAKIAPIITEDLLRRVRDLHKDIQKGQTKSEAEFKYLELCAKGHHLYGVWRFDAKDSKSNPVQVGVSAHGVGIYGDHSNPRLHMFAWQDIIKIAYRRNKFTIQLKEGVLDNKKEMTVTYRLSDYPAAKRLWKCGVEHHTFFRLVQAEPDIKPKHGLFRWGSSRFRYSGRTQLQTRMASNSYANSPGSTMQRTESGRVVSQSVDDIAQKQPTSPLRFVDDPTRSKDLVSSPEKSYPISEIEDDKKKAKKSKKDKRKAESDEQLTKKKDKKEKGKKKDKKDKKKAKKAKKGEDVSSTSSSSSDSASDTEVEKRHILIPGGARRAGSSSDQVVPTGTLGRARELDELGGPQGEQDISTPHTTVHTWHETTSGPEEVTTEVDEHGNVITRTVKTQQVKHTIQKQSYQTFAVNDGQPGIQNVELSHQTITPVGISPTRSPVLETHTRTIAYEAGNGHENGATPVNGNGVPGEFVSSKTVTSGNRTIETITYKVEKDGVIETHVEHRVTIHSGDDIDHDAELSQAILEATAMNPNMTVEKIEVKQETTC